MPQRLQRTVLVAAGGLIYLAVFAIRYSALDADLFQYRDDGVVTMSVGRHIVDYGFVGVSPSGPIVDASSSPLQTLLYALTYSFSGIGYAEYSWLQTYAATFTLGAVFTAFFLQRPLLALLIAAVSATGLTFFYPFFLWHASGMENALTHVLYVLSAYLLYRMILDKRIRFASAIPLFLAAIVRIESVVHIALLLLCFSAFWWHYQSNFKALLLSAVVGALWIAFQVGRWVYFGDIVPNTAYAQGISVASRLESLFLFDLGYIYSTLKLCAVVFIWQGWWIVLFAWPMYLSMARTQSNLFLLASILLLACSLSASPFLFGPARIDLKRTTTQLTPLLFLVICFAAFHTTRPRTLTRSSIAFLALTVAAYSMAGMGPYYLGWSTRSFDQVRLQFRKLANEHRIHRATVSNPDLGVMTWHKDFNVIDLGMLGSPEMARLTNGPEIRRYFFEYALPDILESHNPWTSRYCQSIFMTEEFHQQYEMLYASDEVEDLCEADGAEMRFWIRRDVRSTSRSQERKFLDSLQQGLDVAKIAAELSACKAVGGSCSYVVRTVFRFVPELRDRKLFDSAVALFTQPKDRAMLEGWRDARARTEILKAIRAM